jgi:hypothetical protein
MLAATALSLALAPDAVLMARPTVQRAAAPQMMATGRFKDKKERRQQKLVVGVCPEISQHTNHDPQDATQLTPAARLASCRDQLAAAH